jgi:1,2-phenylacetyl-CoA epoxidase catalytic subunit
MRKSVQPKVTGPVSAEMIEREYGKATLDLILIVMVNFHYSEIEIMDLCGKWIPRRANLVEKGYLVKHASDELRHAKLFRQGVERLGIDWDAFDHDRYRIRDIDERFQRLHDSDDELEVLIGLNLYAEGVLALEEIQQLGRHKPEIFYEFDSIYKDELTHHRFGVVVARRLIAESPENARRAQEYCDWYKDHLDRYLGKDLEEKLAHAIRLNFIAPDYVEATKQRFHAVMGELGLRTMH